MAAPNPEKEIARLRSVLERDPKPRAVLLCGPARWFRERALAETRRLLGKIGDVVELEVQEGGTAAEAGELFMDLRTPSLFGARRTLVVRNAERWLAAHGAALADVLDRIVPQNTLVIVAAKLDGRTSLARDLKKKAEVFEFRELYAKAFGEERTSPQAELVQWLAARARGHGLDLEPRAALTIVELVGEDPAQIDGELVRLASLFRGQRVTADVLQGELVVSFGSTQFEFVDAILGRDAQTALRSLRALYREGVRDRDGRPIEPGAVFPLVTSWLLTSLGKLFEARAEIEAGASRAEVVAKHGGFFKERFARQLDVQTRESLAGTLFALRQAERRLRATGEDPEVLLERLVAEVLLPGRRHLLGQELAREPFAW